MPVTVTYSFAGQPEQTKTFTDDTKEIRFGRSVKCDVDFPEELSAVGHTHFSLERKLDGYRLVVNVSHPVYVDGKPAFDGMEIEGTRDIRLGAIDGPRVTVTVTASGALPYWIKTIAPEKPMKAVWQIALETRSGLVTVALATVVAVGAIFGGVWLLNQRADLLTRNQTLLKQAQQLVSEQVIALHQSQGDLASFAEQINVKADFSQTFERVSKSVYLVDAIDNKGDSIGGAATAWVVQLSDGTRAFATNSHVAELFDRFREVELRMVVRSPVGDHRQHEISDVQLHPGYREFPDVARNAVSQVESGFMRAFDMMPAYDVALLIPSDQAGIGEPLKLADPAKLNSLKNGMPLALVGYPMEDLARIDAMTPTPQHHTGILTSTTNFLMSQDASAPQLLQHTIASAGGASGSPIIDADGDVVGVHNAGNFHFVLQPRFKEDSNGNIVWEKGQPVIESWGSKRIPSASLVNFGQRVDLLRDLLDGKIEDHMIRHRAEWQRQFSHFVKPLSSVLSARLAKFGQDFGQPMIVREQAGKIETPDDRFNGLRTALADITLEANNNYLVVAMAAESSRTASLAAFLFQENPQTKEIDLLEGRNTGEPIADFVVATDANKTLKLAVIDTNGAATATNYTLTIYQAAK